MALNPVKKPMDPDIHIQKKGAGIINTGVYPVLDVPKLAAPAP